MRALGFRGHKVSGTFLATPADPTMLTTAREAVAVEREDLFSATLLDSVLLCRYLGDSAESARRCFTDAWRVVRPGLLGREAQPRRGFGGREWTSPGSDLTTQKRAVSQ